MLEDGYHDVPAGYLAMVVTHLQMREKPAARPAPELDLSLTQVERPGLEWYRGLFRRVGQDYLWFGRLVMEDAALEAILHDPKVEVYVLKAGEAEAGLLELDFREEGACELAYFGLTSDHVGGGAGRWLMNEAIARAWAKPITRFHVHTCTLDSPQALGFYIRSGFTAYRREVEIAEDPRLSGLLPETAAPQIPLIPSSF